MGDETKQPNASAFGSPEGSYDPNLKSPNDQGNEGEGGGTPPNTPPPDEQPPNEPSNDGEGGNGNPPDGDPPKLDYNTLFTKAAEKIGVQAPENIEEDVEKFVDFVVDSAKQRGEKQQEELLPDAKRFNEALKIGTKPEDFFKEYTEPSAELNLPDDQFMVNYLKNQNGKTEENENGWSDEEIQERVNRMKDSGILESQAFEQKQKRKAEIESQRNQQQQESQKQQEEQNRTVKEQQGKAFNELMDQVDKIDTIGGAKVTPEEHKEFKGVFKDLLDPVSEDSDVRPLDMLLHNNNELYKMLFMYYNGTNKFNRALTEAKEKVKNQFVQKLNLNPDVGSGQSQKPNTVDVSKFASPEM